MKGVYLHCINFNSLNEDQAEKSGLEEFSVPRPGVDQ